MNLSKLMELFSEMLEDGKGDYEVISMYLEGNCTYKMDEIDKISVDDNTGEIRLFGIGDDF